MVPSKRIDDLPDHTVQGIWDAHLRGEVDISNVLDDTIIRCAGVLAEKGYWMWMFMLASEEGSCWRDLDGDYWVVDRESGEIREWGT